MKTIERMTVTANGESRGMELRRDDHDNGKSFWSIWYAGDETGEYKKQFESGDKDRVMEQWQAAASRFGVTPESV